MSMSLCEHMRREESGPEPLLPHGLMHDSAPCHKQECHPRDGRPTLSAFILGSAAWLLICAHACYNSQ